MQFFTSSRNLMLLTILLGIAHSVCPWSRPSVLLKRSILRRRLLAMPGTLRPKRQLFREDIPHHRPLTGNTYYLHAGFPHPSRWHDGSQVIPPDPNPITHHHLHNKPGLHDDLRNNNNHDHHNNNHVNHEHQHQLINPNPPSHHFHQHQHEQQQQQHHHHHHNHNGLQEPVAISVVNNKTPHTVNIHSAIVHANGVSGGGVIDNSLGNPNAPVSPVNQANFDPLLPHHFNSGQYGPANGNFRNAPRKRPEKPHSEPEPYEDEFNNGGDYGLKDSPHGISDPGNPNIFPPETVDNEYQQKGHERKPKTIIHYHPVTVGNIINFNDDNKPVTVNPNHGSYGPPEHVPGIPLSNKDVMMSLAEPFINSPFKTVHGPPEFLDFTKNNNDVQYGPPQHVPGVPLGNLNLEPMLPSFGPPVKSEAEPPYGVALPVIAHIHSGPPRHHHPPPKRHRGKGRSFHQHHLHLHHIHHPPLPVHAPVEHPSYIVHGHVPNKFVSFHNPHFRSHSHHHHHKSFWSW